MPNVWTTQSSIKGQKKKKEQNSVFTWEYRRDKKHRSERRKKNKCKRREQLDNSGKLLNKMCKNTKKRIGEVGK